ncbi:hypothetical protein [Actinokineospora fastidiosa]|uniref:Uncharacterized protein n=1 Tax=Actinokineospora fastidiosa TaxID=1816 RepID=A0A918G784_9PSEU|nr:hypothetical protein [Actinokineospora fastidiosa]GGS20991.1 hypothetical protein GCM10010171_12090 [Actinokineospora fastidiosa]
MYVDDAGGARIGTTIGESMAGFAATAQEGGFAVSGEGGEALLRAVYAMADWVDSQRTSLAFLQQEAPLGSTHGAMTMKPYLQQVASDGAGFVTQLEQFREALIQAEQGIKQAMANYQDTDKLNADKLR